MKYDFLAEAQALAAHAVNLRRDFHRHPELAFQERRTAQVIAEELSNLGLEVQTGLAKTGVVAILEGAHDGPTIGYRADMDALPIREETGLDFTSVHDGVMHACGHDGHMAIALTVARWLADHRHALHGRVKFIFQPGEEGAGGALAMLREGALDNPAPDVLLGLHLWQPLPLGRVGLAEGAIMSGSSTFRIVVKGRGGHAAMPHTTVDPVACSGQLITALHTIVGRRMDAMAGAVVLSVTGLRTSSYAHNIIPEQVEIIGTFRTFNAYTSEMLEQHVRDVSRSVCESVGCTAEVTVRHLTIPVVNDRQVVRTLRQTFAQFLGEDALDADGRTMASEDVAYMLEDVRGAYFLLGCSNANLVYGHHHPRFDIDERALPLGVALMLAAIGHYVLEER
ncbi:MAG: M20 family metallopeptidase [Anaerolineae bacterium]|nr:M20 family metallopeptidase [Anaerolineae bacterium]MDW8172964.1 M20 family metallopeptidase [Anaerolineae bacterium]